MNYLYMLEFFLFSIGFFRHSIENMEMKAIPNYYTDKNVPDCDF